MWDQIWNGIRAAMLAFFGPPDVDDESALRAWLEEMLGLLAWIAARTRTSVDDEVVAGLTTLVEDEEKWGIFHPLIVKLLGDGVIGEAMSRGDEAGTAMLRARSDMAAMAEEMGIPIFLLIRIVLMLLKLLRR